MTTRITKTIRAAIVRQFVDGAAVSYIAGVYQVPQKRIEDVLRDRIITTEALLKRALARPESSTQGEPENGR